MYCKCIFLKALYCKGIFLIESIKIRNELSKQTQYLDLHLDSLNKISRFKNHSLYLKLILLLPSDISLNPGPNRTNHQLTENLKVFKNRGLHFIHLNINSLLSKIDELREIVKASNVTVLGITESKLDDSTNKCEIYIVGYNIIRRDRNRKGRGVVCYASNKICFSAKNCISSKIKNIFIELRILKTKSITFAIIYKPPDQLRFLNILPDSLNTLNILNEEWNILGNLNIKSRENGTLIREKK